MSTAAIPVPSSIGAGAAVPVSGEASGRTVIYAGGAAGDLIDLEGSIDDVSFAPITTIAGAAQARTFEDRSTSYRAHRRGGASGGVMNVSLGASSTTQPPATSTADPNTIALRDGNGSTAFHAVTAKQVIAGEGLFESLNGGDATFAGITYTGPLAVPYSGGLRNIATLANQTDLHLGDSSIPAVWLNANADLRVTVGGGGEVVIAAQPGKLGFFGAPPAPRPIVSGSRHTSPEAIVQTLVAAGVALGLWEDSTTD